MKKLILTLISLALLVATIIVLQHIVWREYSENDFDIERIKSTVDYNQNGIDDYTDFLYGARKDAENKPDYDGAYIAGGYPPEDIGVCSDVVWRAFREAGYCLRMMIDKDIEQNPEDYPAVKTRDNNIDFRRVKNLYVFFKKYAVSLTTDIKDIEQWQPGDIVIFGDNKHIGIISDKRNMYGQPYVIHNGGQPKREEDYIGRSTVTSHFRFDASLLPEEFFISWGSDGAVIPD